MAVRKEEVVSPGALALQIGVPDANGSVWIPLNRLKDSPKNVRTVPHTKEHIKTLAALIDAYGQLYPLIIETELGESGEPTGSYLVNGGKGRRLAQTLRVKQKKIRADEPIWCRFGSPEQARELSLAENAHAAMHPADQFVAFKDLIDQGKPIEDVAAAFGVDTIVVRRRLKLANVAPEFLTLYRKGDLTLEHLMALAVTDDQERQRKVWNELPSYNRNPVSVRAALTQEEVSSKSPLARFVGEAYRKAGGELRQDLFSKEDEGFIIDVELLNRLADEKLGKAKARVQKEGFAWVEVRPHVEYGELSQFGRVRTVLREPTQEEATKIQALAEEAQTLQSEAEALPEDAQERSEAIDKRLDEIDEEEAAIEEAREEIDPAQQALAGAIVTIDHEGKLNVERGLIRPEDKKKAAAERQGKQEMAEADAAQSCDRTHSAALLRNLTAHRTMALQATLVERPDLALIAITHRLIIETFLEHAIEKAAVHVHIERPHLHAYASDLKETRAHKVVEKRREALTAQLPREPHALFSWILQQSQDDVLKLLAFCVATTLHGVQDHERASPADELARAAGLDMRDWWSATAANYFSRVSKTRVIDAVTEAVSPEAASALRVLKKADAANLAEQRVAGTGWLPAILRGATA